MDDRVFAVFYDICTYINESNYRQFSEREVAYFTYDNTVAYHEAKKKGRVTKDVQSVIDCLEDMNDDSQEVQDWIRDLKNLSI